MFEGNLDRVVMDLDDSATEMTAPFIEFVQTDILKIKPEPLVWELDRYDLLQHYPDLNVMDALLAFEAAGGFVHTLKPTVLIWYAKMFNKLGIAVDIMTARGWMNDGRKATEDWINMWDFPCDRLIVTGLHESKADRIKLDYRHPPIHMFEDNPKHIVQCASVVQNMHIVHRPWNHSIQGFNRIKLTEE